MKHPPQEPEVVPGRLITGVGLGVVASTIAGVALAFGIGHCQSNELGHDWVPPMAKPEITGEINAMETKPFTVEAQGLDEHRLEEERLRGYGWIDRAHQIVHVPIDVAIDLYLSKQPGGHK